MGALLAYSDRITAPVLVVAGERDRIFCGQGAGVDCTSDPALRAHEEPNYSNAPCLEVDAIPEVGHDINLHLPDPQYQRRVLEWADAVSGGGCPDG